jgi:hypothetical protein
MLRSHNLLRPSLVSAVQMGRPGLVFKISAAFCINTCSRGQVNTGLRATLGRYHKRPASHINVLLKPVSPAKTRVNHTRMQRKSTNTFWPVFNASERVKYILNSLAVP